MYKLLYILYVFTYIKAKDENAKQQKHKVDRKETTLTSIND